MAEIDKLLRLMDERNVSDLHLTTGQNPCFRLDGDMNRVEDWPLLTSETNSKLIQEIMPDTNLQEFEEVSDTDFAYELAGVGRFRVNVFHDYNGPGAVLRRIPTEILTAKQLGLPEVVYDMCNLQKGLVLVTGPTGSGKSTTLAAMIDYINRTRSDHILTIEDPVEFVHTSNKCLINQREVHTHTRSFSAALRAALREDPDIILVGEMRDLETIETAIETAETGHLVFGTLHTNTAASAVNRIIDKFPAERQNQIRTMLAEALKGVFAQTLCKKKTGGRVAAIETLIATSAVASNIREGKTHQISSAMQTGKSQGMQMLEDELVKYAEKEIITPEEALAKATDKNSMRKRLAQSSLHLGVTADTVANKTSDTAAECATETELLHKYQADLQNDPDRLDVINNLAWLLATSSNDGIRDGTEAIRLAERAYATNEGISDPRILDTLAAAYAADGSYEKAISIASMSMQLAVSLNEKELVDEITRQISCYKAQKPYLTPEYVNSRAA
jgi:twitching motility protein PilT